MMLFSASRRLLSPSRFLILAVAIALSATGFAGFAEAKWDRQAPRVFGADLDTTVRVKAHSWRAERFAETEHWDRALEEIDQLIAIDPEEPYFWAYMGKVAMAAGQNERAMDALERQVELGVNIADTRFRLGRLLAERGDSLGALDQLEQAVRAGFYNAEKLMHDDFDAFEENEEFDRIVRNSLKLKSALMGDWKKRMNGDADAAVEKLEELVEIAPEAGFLWRQLGYTQLVAGREADSIASFERQIELSEAPHLAWYNLACAKSLRGDLDEAMADLERAYENGLDLGHDIAADPDLNNLHELAGWKRLIEAREQRHLLDASFKRAIQSEDLADLQQVEGEMRRLGPAYRKAREGKLHHYIAMAYHKLGEYERSTASFEEAARAGHVMGASLYNIACGYARQGKTDEALSYLEKAMEIGYSDAQWMQQDEDLESLREEPGFLRLVERANEMKVLATFGAVDWDHLESIAERKLTLEKTNSDAWHRLGWAMLQGGRYDQAIDAFEREAEYADNPAVAYYNIGCSYALMGKSDKAFRALERARQAGFDDAGHLEKDPDLESLRDDARFDQMIRDLRHDRRQKSRPTLSS